MPLCVRSASGLRATTQLMPARSHSSISAPTRRYALDALAPWLGLGFRAKG